MYQLTGGKVPLGVYKAMIKDLYHVYVALEGSSFCAACFKTFKFILSNPAQAAVNTVVSKLLTVLAMVAIPVVCAAGAYACERAGSPSI